MIKLNHECIYIFIYLFDKLKKNFTPLASKADCKSSGIHLVSLLSQTSLTNFCITFLNLLGDKPNSKDFFLISVELLNRSNKSDSKSLLHFNLRPNDSSNNDKYPFLFVIVSSFCPNSVLCKVVDNLFITFFFDAGEALRDNVFDVEKDILLF